MKELQPYTSLLTIIQRYLCSQATDSSNEIEREIYRVPLYFNVLGKDFNTFVTDLRSSIQIEYANKNLQQETVKFLRNPINKLVTNYYIIKDCRWHPFNCRFEFIQKSHDESEEKKAEKHPYHAYQPQFYFKQEYAGFCVEKKKASTYFLPCNRIKICKWRFKIVNVNQSGWYAPIIEAIDFKIEQKIIREDFSSVSCVIYEQKIRLLMEKLRLKQLRGKKIQKLPHEEQQISMLYFLKDIQKKPGNKRTKNIFKVDTEKELLTYRKDPSLKYVIFGQSEGVLTLTECLTQTPISYDKIKLMSMERLKVLFNTREVNKPEEEQPQLWSSSDEEGEGTQLPIVPMIDEDEQSNDDEDPLRNLYLKEFKSLSLGK